MDVCAESGRLSRSSQGEVRGNSIYKGMVAVLDRDQDLWGRESLDSSPFK